MLMIQMTAVNYSSNVSFMQDQGAISFVVQVVLY